MRTRSPRMILAATTALALAASVLAPTAAMAKGPGSGDRGADRTADQPQAQQQVRARDGSGANSQQRAGAGRSVQLETKANAGSGGQVRTRAGDQNRQAASGGRNANRDRVANAKQGSAQNGSQSMRRNAGQGQGKGPNEDGRRDPGTCGDCDAEMGELTDEQAAGLIFMANEEKMAHDVYAAFAELYGTRIFGNIAEAEARHQEAVNAVLQRYGLEDTAFGLPAGQFSDPLIASLYETLVEQGSESLEEALAAGKLIEETDIADLESRLSGLEESAPDVFQMYSNLLTASGYHLSAFEAWLS